MRHVDADYIAVDRISRASSASSEAGASLFRLTRQCVIPSARAYGLSLTINRVQGKTPTSIFTHRPAPTTSASARAAYCLQWIPNWVDEG